MCCLQETSLIKIYIDEELRVGKRCITKTLFSLDNDMWAEVSGGTLCVSVCVCDYEM